MQRTLVYVALLIILSGAAFLIWSKAPRLEEPSMVATTTASVEITTVEHSEDTEGYSIDVRYPQFGIESVDAVVRSAVETAIAAFKEYPTDRQPDSAIPKNEQVISFNSVYTGADYISVGLMIAEYTGGAHPNSVLVGINVDRTTGEEVALDGALALIGKSLDDVALATDTKFKADLGDAYFSEGSVAKPENYGTFLIGKDKVTFIFNNYQVAPYAAGAQNISFTRIR